MRRKLVYLLYRAAQWAGLPFIVLYAVFRIRRDSRYGATLKERLGWIAPAFEQTSPGAIWLHAVSVGEVIAAAAVLRRVRERFAGVKVFVSVSTLAGREVAESRLGELADGVFYAPVDYVSAVRRVLRTIRPALLVVMETEIWPNLWREARRSGARVMVVNGRISDKAWPRYRRLVWLFSAVLAEADLILAQSAAACARYRELGARPERVVDGGNLKYDFTARELPAEVGSLLERIGPAQVWIAASTMPPAHTGDCDEHETVLAAFRELAPRFPKLLLMLAPRKPDQFDSVAELLARSGVHWMRRSTLTSAARLALPGVLLVDTMGELSALFSAAAVVFMGGTLAERGGHNILEPSFYGKAVISGPHLENFAEIAAEFRELPALLEIHSAGDLTSAVAKLLEDTALRDSLGERALRLARSKTGAADLAAMEAIRLAQSAAPTEARGLAARWVLAALSRVWAAGSRWKQQRDLARSRRLAGTVISIGGLAMGGTGKTPFALWLARRLRERGIAVAFLTRGYRRRSGDPVTVIPAGAEVSSTVTGDEAQLLVRSGLGAVGIGADRHAAGLAVRKRFPVDTFLLDDGFQHRRIERDLDIVVLDALDPFAGGLFPVGRLREPVESLGRAAIVVLNRARPGREYTGVIDAVRRHNRTAPIFLSRPRAATWSAIDSAEQWPADGPPFDHAIAFCGLGNPAAFWITLEDLAVAIPEKIAYRDHHVYRRGDLERIAARARELGIAALMTTEKDAMNLPEGAAAIVAPAGLFVLRVELEVEDGERLVDAVLSGRTETTPRTDVLGGRA